MSSATPGKTTIKVTKKQKAPEPLVDANEQHNTRLSHLCHVFGIADSTLAGHKVICKTGALGGGTPAASSQGIITFDPDAIRDVNTTEGLVKVNGLNYHELSHVLFTPQKGELIEWVIQDGTYAAFNVLEDQRIETLLVAQYASVTPYLIATVAEYFADTDPQQHKNSWPYLYGRKYLPKNMRDYFESEAKDPKLGLESTMRMCESIINAYCKLNTCDRRNNVKARELIQRFSNIIGQQQQFSPFGHGTTTVPATGGAPSTTPGQQANANAKALGKAGKGAGGPQTGQQSKQQGNGAGGTGAGGSTAPINKTNAGKSLKAVAGAQAGTTTVKNDIRRQREAMKTSRVRGSEKLRNPDRGLVDVDDNVRRMAKNFGKQLQQLVVDSDPGWHKHQSSGRINVQRAMNGVDVDEVFDTWDSGKQDADSLEMVVMGDSSGSMDRVIDAVADCMWMFKFGAEKMGQNAQVSVMTFDSTSEYFYKPEERAHPTMRKSLGVGGSTNPGGAIDECLRIMANSKRKRKLALFVTDGGWWGSNGPTNDPHADNIEKMNQHGITTACVYLVDQRTLKYLNEGTGPFADPNYLEDNFRHSCTVFTVAVGVDDLSAFGRHLVKATVRG